MQAGEFGFSALLLAADFPLVALQRLAECDAQVFPVGKLRAAIHFRFGFRSPRFGVGSMGERASHRLKADFADFDRPTVTALTYRGHECDASKEDGRNSVLRRRLRQICVIL